MSMMHRTGAASSSRPVPERRAEAPLSEGRMNQRVVTHETCCDRAINVGGAALGLGIFLIANYIFFSMKLSK